MCTRPSLSTAQCSRFVTFEAVMAIVNNFVSCCLFPNRIIIFVSQAKWFWGFTCLHFLLFFLQALWCNFAVPQNKKDGTLSIDFFHLFTLKFHLKVTKKSTFHLQCCFPEEEVEQTVCIVQSTCINVHTVTGKDFIAPLPFQVLGLGGWGGHTWEILLFY